MTARVHKAGSIGRRRRWILYVAGVGVWLTGGLWLIFHYFLVKQGEFGPVTNPLEPLWLKLHGAFAFASLWIFGLLWGIHITRLWPHKRKRWSGGILTGTFIVLILSGYLLYYVGDDNVRPFISALHWVIGLACPCFFLWHRLARQRRRPAVRKNTVHDETMKEALYERK